MESNNKLFEKINTIRSNFDFMTGDERNLINGILDNYVVNLIDIKMTDNNEVVFESKDYNFAKRFLFNRFFNKNYKHNLIDKMKNRIDFYYKLINKVETTDENNYVLLKWLYDREFKYSRKLSEIQTEFEKIILNSAPLWMLNTYISALKPFKSRSINHNHYKSRMQIVNMQKGLLHDEYYNLIMSEFETSLNRIVEENYYKTQNICNQ